MRLSATSGLARTILVTIAPVLVLTGCGGGGSGPAPAPSPPPVGGNPTPPPTLGPVAQPGPPPALTFSAELQTIFTASEDRWDALHPLSAQLQGKAQYAGRFGNYLDDAYYAGLQDWATQTANDLAGVDRTALTEPERVAVESLDWRVNVVLARLEPANQAFERGLAINHMTGLVSFYPNYASGAGAIAFDTLADYEANLTRNVEYAAELDATITALQGGAAQGIVESRVTIDIVISQIDATLTATPEQSPFYRPALNFPTAVPAAEHARLTNEYRAMVADVVDPALRRLRNYLANEYRAQARTTPGLAALPGGRTYYQHLIETSTSLDLTAAEIHQIGRDATQAILDRMDAIRQQDGFSGTLDAFDNDLHNRPGLGVSSRAALVQLYRDIGTDVDAIIGHIFLYGPSSELVIEPYDAVEEQFIFAATYTPGTADGSRPGLFQFNASQFGGHQLSATSLYLHEGVPGHHYQIMLAREAEGLPWHMQQTGLTAFIEGWALYAETLGYDLLLYEDPLIEYGHLRLQLLRSLRLVVDTGIHDQGWSRQQAIQFMIDNGPYGNGISGEIDRYIAIPSQALGYWLGQERFAQMRARAENDLGAGFDLGAFHHEMIGTGTVPFPVLESKLDAWIASQ